MLSVVPDRRRWRREHPVEVVSVVLTPPFLPSKLAAHDTTRLPREPALAQERGAGA
jgi:hypothetical protein